MKYFKVENTHITFIGSFHDLIQERYRCERVGNNKYVLLVQGIKQRHILSLMIKSKVKLPQKPWWSVQKFKLIDIYHLLSGVKKNNGTYYLGI